MKKRLPLIIFTAIYLLSLAAGFSIAGIRQGSPDKCDNVQTSQENWILVRVNDMTLENPSLVSVWAMFLTFSPGPQIFFKPIYTIDGRQNSLSNLAEQFAVSSDRSISKKFIQALDRLNIRRSGMVILDDLGFKTTSEWLNSSLIASQETPFIPSTGLRSSPAKSMEYLAYEEMCASLSLNHPRTQALPWRTIFPNHVILHPGLVNFANIWEQILSESANAHCEVVPGS